MVRRGSPVRVRKRALDELPEFQQPVQEALRQPLEDRIVAVVARAAGAPGAAGLATSSPFTCWRREFHLLEA
jgi:hypothetical protein